MALHARNAHSDLSGVRYRRRATGLPSDLAMEFEEGNRRTDAPRRSWGCKMVVPIPNVEVIDPAGLWP